MKAMYPIARTRNIVVQDLKDETLIYDLDSNKALCLNITAALVWRECDGFRPVYALSILVSRRATSPISEDSVRLALKQLKEQNLLENTARIDHEVDGLSRREIVKRIGLASLSALPVIVSIVAPSAAHAQSGACGCDAPGGILSRQSGCACGDDDDCCSGLCIGDSGAQFCSGPSSGAGPACCAAASCLSLGSECINSGQCCGNNTICAEICLQCIGTGTLRTGLDCTVDAECCSNNCAGAPGQKSCGK